MIRGGTVRRRTASTTASTDSTASTTRQKAKRSPFSKPVRQAGDHADQLQVTAFPVGRQALLQALLGEQRCPRHAQHGAGQPRITPGERRRLPTRARPEQPGGSAEKHRHDQRERRQLPLSLEKPDPHGEGENVGAHAH
jgi:hypothetical protein